MCVRNVKSHLLGSKGACYNQKTMPPIEPSIKNIGIERAFKKGTSIFNAEDPITGFYQVVTGEVRIFKMDLNGNELEISRLGPGDFLGEAVTFTSDTYPLFAEAVRDTRTLFFEKKKIFAAIEKDPKLSIYMIKLLAGKCLALNKRLETLGLKTIRQRLIQYILELCPGQGNCALDLPIKKTEIAKLLGTVSETLSRNLRQLQDEDLITVKGKTIRIKNCQKLRCEIQG